MRPPLRGGRSRDQLLSGSVQSTNPARAMAVAKRIRSGTISINKGVYFGADAPFGGYKQSGIGREMGLEGFEEYLETRPSPSRWPGGPENTRPWPADVS